MKVTWCSHFKRSRAAANRRLGRRKMLAKQANTREAWRICTRFACTGRGRRPDAPGFVLLFSKAGKRREAAVIVAAATKIAATGGRKARVACCPDRGMLSMQWKAPKGKRFYVLFASTKRTGSSRRAAALSTPGDRFKTLWIMFFRDISSIRL